MDRRSIALVSLVTVAAAAASAGAQEFPFDDQPATIASATNTLTGQRDPNNADLRMFLFRLHRSWNGQVDGIEQKTWSGTGPSAAWSGWTLRTNTDVKHDDALGTSLFALGGEYFSTSMGLYLPRFQAFYNYRSSTAAANELVDHRLAMPYWNWLETAYNWVTTTPLVLPNGPFYTSYSPAQASADFEPKTGYNVRVGSNQVTHLFGISHDYSANYKGSGYTVPWWDFLRETVIDSSNPSNPSTVLHGVPDPHVDTMRMGPKSAVYNDASARTYVFASANMGYEADLFVRYNGLGCPGASSVSWCWVLLGRPSNYATEMGTPTPINYNIGSTRRVAMFVTARVSGYWHLYGRYTDDRLNFSAWQDFGYPPNASYTTLSSTGFDISTGVVYYMGSTMRINMFGNTAPYDRATSGLSAHGGGHLIEFFWDGGTWRWGMDQQPPAAPSWWGVEDRDTQFTPPRFQVMSASSIDTPAWERLSVFGQDEFGSEWELFWDGVGGSWHWQEL